MKWDLLRYNHVKTFLRPSSRRKLEHENSANTDEAQKKFGNAKAISSDMYFGKQDHAEVSVVKHFEILHWLWFHNIIPSQYEKMSNTMELPKHLYVLYFFQLLSKFFQGENQ